MKETKWQKFKKLQFYKDISYYSKWGFFGITIICLAVLLVKCILDYTYLIESDLQQPYLFGGVLSGVFSGLAFLGVIFTLVFQMKDSKRQRKTNDIQRFETTFFNMIPLLDTIINRLYLKSIAEKDNSIQHIKGNIIFEEMYFNSTLSLSNKEKYRSLILLDEETAYSDTLSGKSIVKIKGGMKKIIEKYEIDGFNDTIELSVLDSYFNYIYVLLKFIDDTDTNVLSMDDKKKYIDIFKSNISSYELIWLFYYGLTKKGKKLKPLFEKYSFLQNIRVFFLREYIYTHENVLGEKEEILRLDEIEKYSNMHFKNKPELYDIKAFYPNGLKDSELLFTFKA